MQDSFLIRELQADDISTVTAIQAQAVLEGLGSFSLVPLSETEMAEKFSKLRENQYPCYVAVNEGQIAGYGNAAPYRPRPGYRWSVEDSIYVSPDYQGYGIGKSLLNTIVSKSTDLGFRQMIAVIGDSKNIASIELHRKCGFELSGTLKNVGFKHGHWLDTVLMQRMLGDGAEEWPEFDKYPGTLFKN